MVDLDDLGSDFGKATGVNNHGQVVGWVITDSLHAFSWTQEGGMIDLGPQTEALAVNDSGEVVGSGGPDNTAFSWTQHGGMVWLGTIGGINDEPVAINNRGQAVGVSDVVDSFGFFHAHAVLWETRGH